jgi:hypothetical protein
MKRQERRGAEGGGERSNPARIEEERPDSAAQPVAPRQVGRPPASAAQDDQLLLEQETLRDHRSYAAPLGHFACKAAALKAAATCSLRCFNPDASMAR